MNQPLLILSLLWAISPLVTEGKTVTSMRHLQERGGKYYLPNSDKLFTGKHVTYYRRGGGALTLKSDSGDVYLGRSGSGTYFNQSITHYENGVKEGNETHWYENGEINIHKIWKDGLLLKSERWTQTNINSFDPSKSIKRLLKSKTERFKDDWLKTTTWYANGIKAHESLSYKDTLHSAKSWWLDGTECKHTNLENGNGVVVKYICTHYGTKWHDFEEEGRFDSFYTYKNGVKHGRGRSWYKNNVRGDYNYENGLKHGMSVFYIRKDNYAWKKNGYQEEYGRPQWTEEYEKGELLPGKTQLRNYSNEENFYDPYKFGYFFYNDKPPYDLSKINGKPTPPKSLPKAPIGIDLNQQIANPSMNNKVFGEKNNIDSPDEFRKQKTELFNRYMAKEISKDEYFHLYNELKVISGSN